MKVRRSSGKKRYFSIELDTFGLRRGISLLQIFDRYFKRCLFKRHFFKNSQRFFKKKFKHCQRSPFKHFVKMSFNIWGVFPIVKLNFGMSLVIHLQEMHINTWYLTAFLSAWLFKTHLWRNNHRFFSHSKEISF